MNQTVLYKHGIALSYADYGDKNGFPILIQHGMIASIKDGHLFDRLIETGARLISIARPGYGDSIPYVMKNIGEWGEIVSFLVNELDLNQFDVLGISSGAPYCYAIAWALPDRVRNVFILSGTPALYDKKIQSFWPFPIDQNASLAGMKALACELFFSRLSEEDLAKDDIIDSMKNGCFGIAQDLVLRCKDWGFLLPEVKAKVTMRHSKSDTSVPFVTAECTANFLPNCCLDIRENDVHFSQEVLDDFIRTIGTKDQKENPKGFENL